jgi:hypothetical protein
MKDPKVVLNSLLKEIDYLKVMFMEEYVKMNYLKLRIEWKDVDRRFPQGEERRALLEGFQDGALMAVYDMGNRIEQMIDKLEIEEKEK